MFARIITLFQMRQSTAFLLQRADDRLLQDIGLTRADLKDMRLGLTDISATPGLFFQGTTTVAGNSL